MLNLGLDPTSEDLLRRERSLLGRLEGLFTRQGLSQEELRPLRLSIEQLDELFLLVVVGEFNAGKSAVINRLLGEKVLEEGVTPTTRCVHLLKSGEGQRRKLSSALELVQAPAAILEHLSIVDTPGTNAIDREHERITLEFLPRSDVVLFVTSADRPFSESERSFLEQIRDWGKKIVFAVNKVDLLRTPEERRQVRDFVSENARRLIPGEPALFLVSARPEAEAAGDEFCRLEEYISEVLDQSERIRLKLLNPLGVARKLSSERSRQLKSDCELLKEDHQTLNDIDAQLETYRSDMHREFGFRLSDVENQLHGLEQRGIEFFDRRMRLARILELLDRDRLKSDFEREVVGNLSQEIDERVGRLIDWMVESDLRQWESIYRHLQKRRTAGSDRIVGEISHSLRVDRQKLVDSFGRESKRTIEAYERGHEASRIAEGVTRAVAGTALAEVGAIGLGAAITAIATSTAIDVTGILAAGTLAVLGLFAIPHRRRKAKKELHQKISQMRTQLVSTMQGRFQREQNEALSRIQNAMAPYSRFVRSEEKKLEEALRKTEEFRDGIKILESEIHQLVS